MKKYLILGSAPYIKDWYKTNSERFRDFILCPMNNAWAVDPEKNKIWFHSEDFFLIPSCLKPEEYLRAKWLEITKFDDTPFFYRKGRNGGTMLLSVLCHLLNNAFYTKNKVFIAIAGSDLIYKNDGKDHFYGKGTPDPLIMGEQTLREELSTIKILAEQFGSAIVNVGGQAETLLPFARH